MMSNTNFWMVYGMGQGGSKVRHQTYQLAKEEAERLSRATPGVEFFVMMPVSVSRRVDVETKELVDLDHIGIPF
jgi:hypothetical protein